MVSKDQYAAIMNARRAKRRRAEKDEQPEPEPETPEEQ